MSTRILRITQEEKRALQKLHSLRNVAILYRDALEKFLDKWVGVLDDTSLYRLIYEEASRMRINVTSLNFKLEKHAMKIYSGEDRNVRRDLPDNEDNEEN